MIKMSSDVITKLALNYACNPVLFRRGSTYGCDLAVAKFEHASRDGSWIQLKVIFFFFFSVGFGRLWLGLGLSMKYCK